MHSAWSATTPKSARVEVRLTARRTRRADAKAGPSDPAVREWKRRRSTDKRYSGDNRLIAAESSHRRRGLAPRCRLFASWGWRRSQGFGCSPIKAERELGSKRRETVWSLSSALAGELRGTFPSTRGPGMTHQWCSGCRASGTPGSYVRNG